MAKSRRLTQKEFESRAKIIGIAVGTIGLSFLSYKLYQNYQKKKFTIQHDKQVTSTGVNLSQVAISIHDAFYHYELFGYTMSEDEEEAIRQLQKVPKSDIKQLALIYNRMYDKNLYEDFRAFLSNSQYMRVENLLS